MFASSYNFILGHCWVSVWQSLKANAKALNWRENSCSSFSLKGRIKIQSCFLFETTHVWNNILDSPFLRINLTTRKTFPCTFSQPMQAMILTAASVMLTFIRSYIPLEPISWCFRYRCHFYLVLHAQIQTKLFDSHQTTITTENFYDNKF